MDAELTSMLGPAFESCEGTDAYAEVSIIQASFSETEHGSGSETCQPFFLLMFNSIGAFMSSVNVCCSIFVRLKISLLVLLCPLSLMQ